MTTLTIEVRAAEITAVIQSGRYPSSRQVMRVLDQWEGEGYHTSNLSDTEKALFGYGVIIGLQIAAMRAEDDREDLRAADIKD